MLRHALYLALRYLAASPVRSAVLVLGAAVAFFLPLFTYRAAGLIEAGLLRRAEASPILIGAKGNDFDLTLSSLYFRSAVADPIPAGELDRVRERDYGLALPLYVGHTAVGAAVVGTDLEYLRLRGLRPTDGRLPALLGEVAAGAEVARSLRLAAGDTARSDLTNLYNLAGGYPILLRVVGVLAPTGTPDDEVFFTDVKTTWVLDGLFHGHGDVTREEALTSLEDAEEDGSGAAETAAVEREEQNVEASAALFLFQEINDTNRASFHMHGSPGEAPLTSILVVPRDQKGHDLLLGDYALEESLQAIEPVVVVRTVLGIVLRAREALDAFFALVAASTLAFFALAVWLSLRLREDELSLMRRIGCRRNAIAMILGTEIALIALAAVLVAVLAAWGGSALLQSRLGI